MKIGSNKDGTGLRVSLHALGEENAVPGADRDTREALGFEGN